MMVSIAKTPARWTAVLVVLVAAGVGAGPRLRAPERLRSEVVEKGERAPLRDGVCRELRITHFGADRVRAEREGAHR